MTKYILSILIIILVGCASLANKQQLNSLEIATDRYGDAIRWGYLEIAEGFIKGSDRDRRSTDFSILKKIRVTSYEILNRTISDNHVEATQHVEIKFYYIDQMIEKTITDKQVWKYDNDEETWSLHGNLPYFVQDQ